MRVPFLPYAVVGILALVEIARAGAALEPGAIKSQSIYAQGSIEVRTYSSAFTSIPGMHLTLPAKTASAAYALLTFDAPNGYMDGSQCFFQISANSTVVGSGSTAQVFSGYTAPLTVVSRVPLLASAQKLDVEWDSTPNKRLCALVTFYSLSVLLTT